MTKKLLALSVLGLAIMLVACGSSDHGSSSPTSPSSSAFDLDHNAQVKVGRMSTGGYIQLSGNLSALEPSIHDWNGATLYFRVYVGDNRTNYIVQFANGGVATSGNTASDVTTVRDINFGNEVNFDLLVNPRASSDRIQVNFGNHNLFSLVPNNLRVENGRVRGPLPPMEPQ